MNDAHDVALAALELLSENPGFATIILSLFVVVVALLVTGYAIHVLRD